MGFALTLVYVAFVLLRPQELYPGLAGYRVMDVLAGLALVATAASIATGSSKPSLRGPELRLGLAFIVWSAITVAAALRWFGGAWLALVELSIPLFTLALVMLNVSTRRRLTLLVVTIWMCTFVLLAQAFDAYYSDVTESPFFLTTVVRGSIDELTDAGTLSPGSDDDPEDPDARRYVRRIKALGFLADPNDFAQCLVCLMPLLWLAWRERRPFRNAVLVLVPAALATWGVLLTRSRGGLIALGGVLAAALILRLGPRWRRPAALAAVALAVPGFVALFGYAQSDSSAASRIEAWSAGLVMLRSSPIWGIGYDYFADTYDGRVAHNSFVQCFAETGLVGYFIWLALIVVTFARLSALERDAQYPAATRWARALLVSLIGFLVAALFLSRTTSPMLFLLVSLPAAFIGIAEKQGELVAPLPIYWLARTLAVEAASILLVWFTVRASH
jgi:hypothetical protein